jgi:hypothetical protein
MAVTSRPNPYPVTVLDAAMNVTVAVVAPKKATPMGRLAR